MPSHHEIDSRSGRRAVARADERGQATILLAGAIVVAAVIGIGLALIAKAMVHRAQARNAADAVALAAVADPGAATELGDWYRGQGITVEVDGAHTYARSGPSQAHAWAGLGEAANGPAPALAAIIARAEQLVGSTLTRPRMIGLRVELEQTDAALIAAVASDLGLCAVADPALGAGWQAFEVC